MLNLDTTWSKKVQGKGREYFLNVKGKILILTERKRRGESVRRESITFDAATIEALIGGLTEAKGQMKGEGR